MEALLTFGPLAVAFSVLMVVLLVLGSTIYQQFNPSHDLNNRQVFAVFGWSLVLVPAFLWGLLLYKSSALQAENDSRLQAWQANGCVAPAVIRESVFWVTDKNRRLLGTGFHLEGDLVVTNRHVATPVGNPGYLYSPDGTGFSSPLLHVADGETRPDLAFYSGSGPVGEHIPALKLSQVAPQPGDALLVVGNNGDRARFHASVVNLLDAAPYAEAERARVSLLTYFVQLTLTYYYLALRPDDLVDSGGRTGEIYVTQGDTAGGNSGSPVLNCEGEVVGVLFGGSLFNWFASEQSGLLVALSDLRQELHIYREDQNRDYPNT